MELEELEKIFKEGIRVESLELSYITEVVNSWNQITQNKEFWENKSLRSVGYKIRSLERLYAIEHQNYTPFINTFLLSYLENLPKKVVIKTKERLKINGFTEDEIKKIEEFARQKLGYYSEHSVKQEFKIYLFFYEDIPSFFYRKQIDDGILSFRISGIDEGTIYIRCTDVWLDWERIYTVFSSFYFSSLVSLYTAFILLKL